MPCGHNEALSDNEKTVGVRIIALKEIIVITNIKDKFKHSKSTIATSLTALIAIAVFTVAIHDTVSASVMQPDGGIDLSGQFGSGTPEGVWSDGSTMWVVDNDSGRLVAYNRSTGDYLADKTIELDSSNGSPRGIWSNTSTIWVSDWDDTHLYAYDLETGNRLADRDIDLTSRNDAPRGITGLYSAILVVDKDDTWVYAYSANDGSRLEDVEFDLNGSNDHPWGIWASDSQIWVSDLDDDSLYAYDFSSGGYEPSRDLRLPRDNRDPRGIWVVQVPSPGECPKPHMRRGLGWSPRCAHISGRSRREAASRISCSRTRLRRPGHQAPLAGGDRYQGGCERPSRSPGGRSAAPSFRGASEHRPTSWQ